MIHELRTYTVAPGKLAEALRLSDEVSRPIRGNDYGKLEGYWFTELGGLNRLVHLWSFPDLNERARLRAALAQKPEWRRDFLSRFLPLLLAQETKILAPALPLKPPAGEGHLYELRTYRTQVGRAGEFIDHLRAVMPAREKYSPNVCLWSTEIGPLNEVSHLWAYDDLNGRAAARARALEDPEWQAFLAKGQPLLLEMQSAILRPAPFSPMK